MDQIKHSSRDATFSGANLVEDEEEEEKDQESRKGEGIYPL